MRSRLRSPPLLVASSGVLGLVLLATFDLETVLRVYLCVAVAFAAVPAGALAVLLISYLVRGAWTEALHLPLTAAALTAPLAGAFFLPVLVGLPSIYAWAETAAGAPGSFRAVYLSPAFFGLRTFVYFAIWTLLAIWARRAWNETSRMTVVASAGLIAYALTGSLAGVDWLESLTPGFHSSIYGLLHMTFQILAGYAFALAVVLARPGAATHRTGAILVSVLLLWAYNHAMQYIIIWSGNIPEEAAWYAQRESGIWGVLLWGLILAQFVVPFFALLSERVRNGRLGLWLIALATMALRPIEAIVLGLPGIAAPSWTMAGAAVAATLAMGGLGWAIFLPLLRYLSTSAPDRRPLSLEPRVALPS